MRRPRSSRRPSGPIDRINGRIRAREVRVIGPEGEQLGVLPLHEAIRIARANQVDLVEVASKANPPVCRVIDYGRYRYEQSKRKKESRKATPAGRVKEVQLSPNIDPHDLSVKLGHAIDFLCEDMKVKATLRFRGRQMAHQEIGIQVMDEFTQKLASYGTAVERPKLVGRRLNMVLNPLPRSKRAPNPRQPAKGEGASSDPDAEAPPSAKAGDSPAEEAKAAPGETGGDSEGLANTALDQLEAPKEQQAS